MYVLPCSPPSSASLILFKEGIILTHKGGVLPDKAREGVFRYKASYKVHMSTGRVLYRRNEFRVLAHCGHEAC